MNDQQQITPTLGPTKAVLIAIVAAAFVWFVVDSTEPRQDDSFYQPSELLPAGCVYGLLATGCWLATVIDHRYGRLIARVGIVIGAATLMGTVREHRPWFQTAADLSGLAIAQCTLFFWLRIPRWRLALLAQADQQQGRRDQFAIADIVIATTVIAVLLSLAIRYSPALQPVAYWLVLAAAWFGGATVTTCIAKAMTSKQTLRALLLLSIGLILAFSGTYAIAVADSIVDEGRITATTVRIFASYYGRIVWGYFLTFLIFAGFGRASPS